MHFPTVYFFLIFGDHSKT